MGVTIAVIIQFLASGEVFADDGVRSSAHGDASAFHGRWRRDIYRVVWMLGRMSKMGY